VSGSSRVSGDRSQKTIHVYGDGMPANDPTGRRFGEAALDYERGRPEYPAAAVDALLRGQPRIVVDLGAGTGKFTRALVGRVETVIAVEPDDAMRAVLSGLLPQVTALPGVGEAIPLPDGSADLVVCAQAWHWVDPARAVPEVARVLRPDGVLGLVWNDRDETDPWLAALGALLSEYGTAPDAAYTPTIGEPFGPIERSEHGWTNHVAMDDVVAMVTSRSYVIALEPARRGELVARVRSLAASVADPETGLVPVPYMTRTYLARRGG
jgi:SAM-dependent methyltransferase